VKDSGEAANDDVTDAMPLQAPEDLIDPKLDHSSFA
jgi:hypothetical protein